MAKTSVPCPNCRQPVLIDLTRLFDLNTDPEAKNKLLSGTANYFECPTCHYQGVYPTPIVFHDPDKELLLTFFPPELGVPVTEQERTIGPLIKKVVDDLPPEKRGGYLFTPRTMLTQQSLFETILEADGITPEMIQAQQEKLALIQKFATANPDDLPALVAENDEQIDNELFLLLSRLYQASAASGDRESASLFALVQKSLVEHSTLGKAAALEAEETRVAAQELQELSKTGLTRESLLELLEKSADSEIRLTTIASMARGGLDYTFFQTLTDKINQAEGEEKTKLETLREKLLTITDAVDQALKAQVDEARALLNELLAADDVAQAAQQALPRISQAFAEVLNAEGAAAQQAQDQEKLQKLTTIASVVQSASQGGEYLDLIQELLQAENAEARQELLKESAEIIDADFTQMLTGLIQQVEQQNEQPELFEKLKEINREILRYSMMKNMQDSAA